MTNMPRVMLVLGAALFLLAACQDTGMTPAQSAQARAEEERAPPLAAFVNMAGTGGLAVADYSRLAQTRAVSEAVRNLAVQVRTDVTAADQQMAALANSHQVLMPTSINERQAALYQQLQALNGTAFDRAYIDSLMQEHTMAIQAYQAQADSSKDPQVRAFAEQHLPTMLHHLQVAREIAMNL